MLTRVPSIVQILVAEMLAGWGMTSLVMALWNSVRPGTFGQMSLHGMGNFVWFAVGVGTTVWLLLQLLQPRLREDSWLGMGSRSYPFSTTHPAYLPVDLIPVLVACFLRWYAGQQGLDTLHFNILIAICAAFPSLRLVCWYLLKLRCPADAATWQPAMIVAVPFYCCFAAVWIAAVAGGAKAEKDYLNMPVVDSTTLTQASFERLVDSNQSKRQSVYLRLRATQSSPAPFLYKNPQGIDFAAVLAELGPAGEVVIVGSGYDRGGFADLVRQAQNNQGKPIEVVGRLSPPLTPLSVSGWESVAASLKLPSAPEAGRWLLEMHDARP